MAAVAATVAAFPWTLRGLYESISSDTPLAYLGLVPLLGLLSACFIHARPQHPAGVEDRQLDWLVALPLLVLAFSIGRYLPRHAESRFWDLRMDYLALPPFVAGAITLLLGTRSLGRVWRPILYLFLAWPPPWNVGLPRLLVLAQDTTIWALGRVGPALGIARPSGSSATSFAIEHSGGAFTMSVALPCSGASAMLGFIVVALPICWVIRGPRLRKAAWIAAGIAVTWVFNVLRILTIFWAGRQWGESVAYDLVHPYLGLVMFMIAMGVAAVLLPVLGLALPGSTLRPRKVHTGGARTRQGLVVVGVLLCAMTYLANDANAWVRDMEVLQAPTGEPRRAPLHESAHAAQLEHQPDRGWGQQFFGAGADWVRLAAVDPSGGAVIWVDDQVTSSWQQLRLHRPETCLNWQGWQRRDEHEIDLVGSVVATVVTYDDRNGTVWTMMTWEWPVLRDGKKAYERIMLHVRTGPGAEARLLSLAHALASPEPSSPSVTPPP